MADEDTRKRREELLTCVQLKSDTLRRLAEEINVNPDEVHTVVILKAREGCIIATPNELEVEFPGGQHLTNDEYIEHIKEDVSQLCTEVEGYYVAIQVMPDRPQPGPGDLRPPAPGAGKKKVRRICCWSQELQHWVPAVSRG